MSYPWDALAPSSLPIPAHPHPPAPARPSLPARLCPPTPAHPSSPPSRHPPANRRRGAGWAVGTEPDGQTTPSQHTPSQRIAANYSPAAARLAPDSLRVGSPVSRRGPDSGRFDLSGSVSGTAPARAEAAALVEADAAEEGEGADRRQISFLPLEIFDGGEAESLGPQVDCVGRGGAGVGVGVGLGVGVGVGVDV